MANECIKCKNVNLRTYDYPCCNCVNNAKNHFAPMRNIDRILSMNILEIVDWIYDHDTKTELTGRWDKKQILQWLQAESEE